VIVSSVKDERLDKVLHKGIESRCTISSMAAFRVDVRKSEEGYSVSVPELPGCWSQGATEAEALANIQIAIQEYVDAAEEMGR